MTSTYTPAVEVTAALVAAFNADPLWSAAPLKGETGGLLFPTWAPRTAELDSRIYASEVELPEDPLIRMALPRILFDVTWTGHDREQDQAGILDGPVSLYLHILTPFTQAKYGELLVAQAILKMRGLQNLSSDRIVASEFVHTATIPKSRITQFNAAWEWIPMFAARNVGVLV